MTDRIGSAVGVKAELHRKLRTARASVLSSLDGLVEYDLRRPMTPTVWEGADMWATPEESSEYLVGLYRRACDHGDHTINTLTLDSPGTVAHWAPERRSTTLGALLIRMVAETAQHAGHADILRELIAGRGGPDHDDIAEDQWRTYLATVQDAADAFQPAGLLGMHRNRQ